MGQGIDLLGSITRILPERPPPAVDGSRFQRLLIVKLSSIGDVIHALPVASSLKRTFPSLRITWAIEEWTEPLVRNHPAVDRVVVFPTLVKVPPHPIDWTRHLMDAVRELRSESYDVTLDLQGLARSAAISLLSRSPLRIARQGQREGAHLVSFGAPLPPGRLHAVEEYLHIARLLGAQTEPVVFALPIDPRAADAVARILDDEGVGSRSRTIVINPSTAKGWKNWAPDRWAQVADALSDSAAVVIAGGPGQVQRHADIARRMRHRPVDLTGRTTLRELMALLDRASLHVAPDTGTVHIAAALGTPVVAVYGPTRPWRVGPYGQPEAVIYHGGRGRGRDGGNGGSNAGRAGGSSGAGHRDGGGGRSPSGLCGRGCPAYCLRRRRCLSAVTPDEVIEKARAVLAAS